MDSVISKMFFLLISLIYLSSVIWATKVADMTARYFRWCMRLYGFDGDVRATPKAVKIVRIWNSIIFVIFLLGAFMIKTN